MWSIASTTAQNEVKLSERRLWAAEWNEVDFTDKSRISLQHHDGRIRVWRQCEDRMLNSCVMHHHTGIMVWGDIGYHSRSPLVRIAGTSNSQRYISEVLESVVLPYLQGLATAIFQQDNAGPHVERIVQRFSVNRQIELLPWLPRSLDLSPLENMWSTIDSNYTPSCHTRSTLTTCERFLVCCTPSTHPKSL
ncbi:transposable element Tcb1 transposase [Trichonephila clavipes]|nr:transposable element Tcb1 transposase [Trichonephila clavipes]